MITRWLFICRNRAITFLHENRWLAWEKKRQGAQEWKFGRAMRLNACTNLVRMSDNGAWAYPQTGRGYLHLPVKVKSLSFHAKQRQTGQFSIGSIFNQELFI
jgi:hypothetical protein